MKKVKHPLVRMVNVSGIQGIGKRRFVIETAYYMHTRSDFQEGIFIVDLTSVKSADQIKPKLKEAGIINEDVVTEFSNKHILLILENIDNVMKYNKA